MPSLRLQSTLCIQWKTITAFIKTDSNFKIEDINSIWLYIL